MRAVMLALVRRPTLILSAFSLLLLVAASCKKTPAGPRACKADTDCVISCESRASCCNNPYCESAQHADDAREIREENEKRCTPALRADCPQIGARAPVNYNVEVHCRQSACVAEHVPK